MPDRQLRSKSMNQNCCFLSGMRHRHTELQIHRHVSWCMAGIKYNPYFMVWPFRESEISLQPGQLVQTASKPDHQLWWREESDCNQKGYPGWLASRTKCLKILHYAMGAFHFDLSPTAMMTMASLAVTPSKVTVAGMFIISYTLSNGHVIHHHTATEYLNPI